MPFNVQEICIGNFPIMKMFTFTLTALAIGCLCAFATAATPTATFTANPDRFQVGKPFTAQCTLAGLSVADRAAYQVTFWLAGSIGSTAGKKIPISAFTMNATEKLSFSGNIFISQLKVTEGKSTYPVFTIGIVASATKPGAQLRCGLQASSLGETEIKSNLWNHSYAIFPSMLLLLFSILPAFALAVQGWLIGDSAELKSDSSF